MQIVLLRHGQTEGNLVGRYVGATDEPLSESGAAALKARGVFQSVKRVFVSPMLRARQTAALLFPNAAQTVLDGLREMDFGRFEGKTAAELTGDAAYRAWVDGGCMGACPGGEAPEAFFARACCAFDAAVRMAALEAENEAYLVTHGGAIMAVMARYANKKRAFYEWHVKNACGYRAVLNETTWEEKPVFLSFKSIGEAGL